MVTATPSGSLGDDVADDVGRVASDHLLATASRCPGFAASNSSAALLPAASAGLSPLGAFATTLTILLPVAGRPLEDGTVLGAAATDEDACVDVEEVGGRAAAADVDG